MNLSSVGIGEVKILVDLVAEGMAAFIPVPPGMLPYDVSRRVGFDGAAWKDPPIDQIIRAVQNTDPVEYMRLDYHYTGGRLHILVDLPYGAGVIIHDHHPVICSPEFNKGIFFAISRMDDLESDVRKAKETVRFSSEVVLSWNRESVVLGGRSDWRLNEEDLGSSS